MIVAVNNSLNLGEVQTGPTGETTSRSVGGMGVGSLHSSELVLKNSAMLFLEWWSAKALAALGIYDAVRAIS